jgi:hypothetical protein
VTRGMRGGDEDDGEDSREEEEYQKDSDDRGPVTQDDRDGTASSTTDVSNCSQGGRGARTEMTM